MPALGCVAQGVKPSGWTRLEGSVLCTKQPPSFGMNACPVDENVLLKNALALCLYPRVRLLRVETQRHEAGEGMAGADRS
jgi:hypothetical protein